jgi:hypothetical protein
MINSKRDLNMIAINIDGLIELIRKLIARKAELNKEFFKEFIQPIWESFVRVHKDYKNSLKEYAQLASKGDPHNTLLERIEQDSVYSSDLRSVLRILVENLPSNARVRNKQAYLSDFIQALNQYFIFEYPERNVIFMHVSTEELGVFRFRNLLFTNPGRSYLSKRIMGSMLMRGNKWLKIKAILFYFGARLQSNYDRVAKTYFRLRKELIT